MKKDLTTLMRDVYHFYSIRLANRLLFAGCILVMILLSPSFLAAQTVKELGSLINEMKQSDDALVKAQSARLENLSYNLNPTLYLSVEGSKIFGENPVCVVVTGDATSKLYDENPLFSQVELIKIKVDNVLDLSKTINLSSLSSFPKLRYIQILCEINCSDTQIQSMLSGTRANVEVCYLVSLPG